MRLALHEAQRAAERDEVPIGCVITLDGRLLGRGHNRIEGLRDPTAHAEILALSAAAGARGDWRLTGADAYVTAEPCVMCMGAFYHARIARVVFGALQPKFGACGSRVDLTHIAGFNHTLAVEGGVLAEESAKLLREYFRALRRDA